jgi:hypothetical protein
VRVPAYRVERALGRSLALAVAMLKSLIAIVMLAAGCGTTLQETQINPAPRAPTATATN